MLRLPERVRKSLQVFFCEIRRTAWINSSFCANSILVSNQSWLASAISSVNIRSMGLPAICLDKIVLGQKSNVPNFFPTFIFKSNVDESASNFSPLCHDFECFEPVGWGAVRCSENWRPLWLAMSFQNPELLSFFFKTLGSRVLFPVPVTTLPILIGKFSLSRRSRKLLGFDTFYIHPVDGKLQPTMSTTKKESDFAFLPRQQ